MEPLKLCAINEDVKLKDYILDPELCTIGRSAECKIMVNRPTVSRLHAKIEWDGSRYVISDTNSANGTFVNGCQIYGPHLLLNDDEIGLASPEPLLRFEDAETTLRVMTRLHYNGPQMTFNLNKKPLELTPSQFKLLTHLYNHAGNICTRESCAQVIWDRLYDPVLDAGALDRIISKLRKQLKEVDPEAKDMIETRRGLGYVLLP